MWSPENAKHDPASQIRWELVPFMRGRVLDLGCGAYKAFPHFVGVDVCHSAKGRVDIIEERMEKLSVFSSQSCDCVYSGHLLDRMEDWKACLKEWWRLVKPMGHMCLYLPHMEHSPKIGSEEVHAAKKHDFTPEMIIEAMEEIGGWDLVENQLRTDEQEFSFFTVFQKISSRKCEQSWKKPKPEKTCGVTRLGAYGDMLQASSIFPLLREQGYSITLYCSDGGYEVVKNDPHVDRFIIQGRDQIPPTFLKEFWDYTKKKYDKWINLSESIEGTLLAYPERVNHEWSPSVKAKYMDVNYLEFTHDLAELPHVFRPKFYATPDEKQWARATANRWGPRNIIWSLSGSSGHKVWPWLDDIIHRIINQLPDTHVVLVGDDFCRLLQTGWDGYSDGKKFVYKQVHPRIHCKSGEWSIRESMAFAQVADLLIGTETGLLNAMGSEQVPKIVTLSHSSEENLTKHWVNARALKPDTAKVPCFPCHVLHKDWTYCHQDKESGAALCQVNITSDQMWDAIVSFSKQRIAA